MEESRPAASELPCLFEALATKYPESLSLCGTKENQMWRFASGNAAVERINIMAKYFPELSLLLDSGVKVPDIYIPDPLNINPNSIDSVEKILLHIGKISGIKEGIRKW